MAIPEIVASMPEMHTRLIVTATDVFGTPAFSAAIRVRLSELYGSKQFPKRTSSISSGATPDRRMASLIATLARSTTCRSLNDPPNEPIAVRQAETITTSFIMLFSLSV